MLILLSGYLFGRFTTVDPTPISKLAIMILSPALIFSFLVRNNLTSTQMIQTVSSVLIFTVVITVITIIFIKITGNGHLLSPSLLSTVFPNTGNFGLPIILLAYGEHAFTLGVVIVVINFILMYSLGVYFASLSGNNWSEGVKNILLLPTTYAAILAIIVNIFNINIPDFLYDPIKMVGEAMIPLVLIILGIQLARTNIKGYLSSTIISSCIKVIIAPIVIFAIVYFLNIEGDLAKVIILQNAMPTAVIMTLIAAEYNSNPKLVANVTFITTVASFFSLTALLYLLDIFFV